MSPASRWLRVGAGFALFLGLTGRAGAWDLFHRCFHGGCAAQTVQIPAQQVVVETARPRVIVQETRPLRVAPVAAAPVVASFYMPMPLSYGMVGAPGGPTFEERREASSINLDSPSMRAAYALEESRLHMEKLQALYDTEVRHMQAVMQRAVAPPSGALTGPRPAPPENCCEELRAQLKSLNDRVTALEQQVIYHDRAIRQDPTLKVPPPPK
jgi:hypothetical protein